MLSIAIPTYEMKNQGAAFLRRCLDSINKQIGINTNEVEILISDQSMDLAIAILLEQYVSRFPIRYIRHTANFGNISANLNFALAQSRFDYIKILFQDDFLLETHYLQALLKTLKEDQPEVIFTASTHTENSVDFFNPITARDNEFLIFGRNTVSSPSVITLHRRVLDQVQFDPKLTLLLDGDFYFHLLQRFNKIVFLDSVHIVNGVWSGQTQHSVDGPALYAEIAHLLEKYAAFGIREVFSRFLIFLQGCDPDKFQLLLPLTQLSQSTPVQSPLNLLPVDVWVYVHNQVEQVGYTIRSALLQSHRATHIWVIDDGSSDDSAMRVSQLFANHPQITLIRTPHQGLVAAHQELLKHSRTPWVAFLNAPDQWERHKLRNQCAYLQSHPHAKGVSCQSATPMSEPTNHKRFSPFTSELVASNLSGNPSSCVIARKLFTEPSVFTQALPVAEEKGAWSLLAKLSHFECLALPLVLETPQLDAQYSLLKQFRRHCDLLRAYSKWPLETYQDPAILAAIRAGFLNASLKPKRSLKRRLALFSLSFARMRPALSSKVFRKACFSRATLQLRIIWHHLRHL